MMKSAYPALLICLFLLSFSLRADLPEEVWKLCAAAVAENGQESPVPVYFLEEELRTRYFNDKNLTHAIILVHKTGPLDEHILVAYPLGKRRFEELAKRPSKVGTDTRLLKLSNVEYQEFSRRSSLVGTSLLKAKVMVSESQERVLPSTAPVKVGSVLEREGTFYVVGAVTPAADASKLICDVFELPFASGQNIVRAQRLAPDVRSTIEYQATSEAPQADSDSTRHLGYATVWVRHENGEMTSLDVRHWKPEIEKVPVQFSLVKMSVVGFTPAVDSLP